jgi:outer membrane protein
MRHIILVFIFSSIVQFCFAEAKIKNDIPPKKTVARVDTVDTDLITKNLKVVRDKSEKIKAESQRLQASLERYTQAKRNILPQLQAELSYGYQQSQRGDFPTEDYPEEAYALTLTQDIYTGGRLSAETKQQFFEMKKAYAQFESVKNQEFLRYFNIYVQMFANLKSQELTRKNIKLFEKMVAIVTGQIQAEEAVQIDLMQVKAELNVEKATLIRHLADYNALATQYRHLIGSLPPEILPSPQSYCQVGDDRTQMMALTLKNSPSLKLMEYGYKSSGQMTDIVDAVNEPKLSLVTTGSYREGQSVFFQAQSKTLSSVLRLSVPIFDQGLAGPREREAEAKENATYHDYDFEKTRILEEFEQLFGFFTASKHLIEANEMLVATNEELLKSIIEEQKLGFKSIYELLEAERNLTEAEYNLVKDQAEHIFAGCRILSLQGKL